MKTKTILTVAGLVLLLNHVHATEVDSWSIQVSGAAHRIGYSDFNDMVNSFNLTYMGDGNPGMEKIDLTQGLNLEVMFRMARFQVGLGIGYLMIPDFEYTSGPDFLTNYIEDYTYNHTANAKIVSVLGTYDLVSLSRFCLYGGAGLNYYITTTTFNETEYGDLDGSALGSITRTWDSELSANQFGLQGFLGIETSMFPRLSLDIRVNARLASISGFMGTQHFHELKVTNANTYERDEDLGVYLVRQVTQEGETEFGPDSNYPLGTDYHKEGKINLSGVGIQLGLKFHFPK
jgi:opacity protein-like surface antigen